MVAAKARALTRFTTAEIRQAAKAYETWHSQPLSDGERQVLIKDAEIEVTSTSPLNWSKHALETDEIALHARLQQELYDARVELW